MIKIAGVEYRSISQDLFVNGAKVLKVYANDLQVYPESAVIVNGGVTRLKSRGPVPTQNNRIFTSVEEYDAPVGVYMAYVKRYDRYSPYPDDPAFSILRFFIWSNDGIRRTVTSRTVTQWEGAQPSVSEGTLTLNRPQYYPINGYAYRYNGVSFSNPGEFEYIEVEGVDLFGTFSYDVSIETIAWRIIKEITGD